MAMCMAFLILMVLFYLQIYLITNIHHNCSGNGCSVCAEIHMAEAIIQQIGSAIQAVLFLIAFLCFITESISIVNQVNLFNTPVKMKVRMND